jgi:hypothetical protein
VVLQEDEEGNAVVAGKDVVFTLGSQTVTVQTDANGEARTPNTFLLSQAPNSYALIASFTPAASDCAHSGATANGQYMVNKEDAVIAYSGAEYFSTGSSTSNQAKIALSATVTDDNDGNRGDVRNAKVDITGGVTADNLNVGLVNPGDLTVGSATKSDITVTLSNSEMGEGGKVLALNLNADGYYTSASEEQLITISVPGADFVTGGGNLVMTSASAGEYAGTAGAKLNFGFTMKYNKSGRNLQGQININFRRYETIDGVTGWYTYKIKSNAINSLATRTEGGYRKAVISTKSNFERTSPTGVVTSLGGNHDLTLEAWEAITGNGHMIAVTLRRSTGGLLFSSNWNGTTTAMQTINGGNIRVLNGGAARVAAVESVEPTMQLAVEASPNPTTGLLKVSVSNAGMQPTVKVRLYNLTQRVAGEWTMEIENGRGEKTIDIQSVDGGMYILSVEGDRSRAVQRVVRAN